MNGIKEFDFGHGVVRIHPGKLSEVERKAVIEEAAKQFLTAIERNKAGKAREVHKK